MCNAKYDGLSIRPRDSNDHTLTSKWTSTVWWTQGGQTGKRGTWAKWVALIDGLPVISKIDRHSPFATRGRSRSPFLSFSFSLSLTLVYSRLSWLQLSLSDYNTTDGGKKQSESEMQHESSCLNCTAILAILLLARSLAPRLSLFLSHSFPILASQIKSWDSTGTKWNLSLLHVCSFFSFFFPVYQGSLKWKSVDSIALLVRKLRPSTPSIPFRCISSHFCLTIVYASSTM